MNVVHFVPSIMLLLLFIFAIVKLGKKVDNEKNHLLLKLEKWRKLSIIILAIIVLISIIAMAIKLRFDFQLIFWQGMLVWNIYTLGNRHLLNEEGIHYVDIFGRYRMRVLKWESVNYYEIKNEKVIINYQATKEKYSDQNLRISIKTGYENVITKYLAENLSQIKLKN